MEFEDSGVANNSEVDELMSIEVPKWLEDAENAAKRERRGSVQKKKGKKLTDDWRFWMAIIATVGFATAFYTINQQTGGFGNNISDFPLSTNGYSSGDLVI